MGGVVKEMVARRQESAGLLSAHRTSPTLSPARDFFFLLLLSYLWFCSFDGAREIKTVQVHVEVEINCGFQTEDVISEKSTLYNLHSHLLSVDVCIKKHPSTHFFGVHEVLKSYQSKPAASKSVAGLERSQF